MSVYLIDEECSLFNGFLSLQNESIEESMFAKSGRIWPNIWLDFTLVTNDDRQIRTLDLIMDALID